MQTKCRRIRLKPGSVDRVREWAHNLNNRRDEVVVTLAEEGVAIESAFLEQTPNGDFLIYYMRAANLEEASRAARDSTHPIDAYHRQVLSEIVDSGEDLELLIDFDGPRDLGS